MANEAGIKIVLDAEISGAVSGLNQVSEAAKKVGKDLNSSVASAGGGFQKIEQQVQKTAKAITDIKPGANQAGLALTNLGRVAQDAPFGFIGIQNNINPLLESFQRLKASTGSTGGALKALGSSLTGAAGLGLAISVVTSLVTAAIQKYGSLGNAVNALFGSLSDSARANKELALSFASAAGSAAGEVAAVTQLVSIAKDKTLSDQTRQQALDKLNKEYDAYLPKLTLESLETQKAKIAIDALTASLIQQAKVKGLQDLISKETSKQAELLAGDLTDNLDILGEIGAVIKSGVYSGLTLQQQRVIAGAKSTAEGFAAAQRRIDLFNTALRKLLVTQGQAGTLNPDQVEKKAKTVKGKTAEEIAKDQISALNDELQSYQKQLAITNKLREAGLITAAKENDALDLQIKIFDKLNEIDRTEVALKLKPKLEIDSRLSALEFQKAITEYTKRVAATPIGTQFGEVNTSLVLNADNLIPADAFDKAIARMREGGQRLEEAIILSGQEIKGATGSVFADIGAAVEDGAASAAVSVGESIADVLSGLDSGGGILRSFGRVLGGVITQIGKMLITAAIAVSGLKKAVNALIATPAGPGIALAAGLAAIVIGKTLENSFSNVKPRPFATGGLVNSPTLGLVGEAGPEVVLPLDRLPGLLKDTGNAGNVNIVGELRADARGIYANFKRWENSANRMGG